MAIEFRWAQNDVSRLPELAADPLATRPASSYAAQGVVERLIGKRRRVCVIDLLGLAAEGGWQKGRAATTS